MPGELDLIAWLRSWQRRSTIVELSVGDDLAILKWPADDLLLVGTDQLLDGVHFQSQVHPPRLIGRKAMNRNLSDCAAMGCLAAAAVATVALPRGTPMDYVKELYQGLRDAGEAFDCELVGGDTASWDGKLAITVSILGRSAGIEPVRRSGARAGDGIYVTGPLGGSILGRHMSFLPRIAEGRRLAETGQVTAMIDLSDGLSRDLRQICAESQVGARIDAQAVPIHPDAHEISRRDGVPALEHALHDGEDHELLFTSRSNPPLGIRVGTITSEAGVFIMEGGIQRELPPAGWEHRW